MKQHFFRVHHKQLGKRAVKGNVADMESEVECLSEGSVKCPLCNKSVAGKLQLPRHIKNAHGYLGFGGVPRENIGVEPRENAAGDKRVTVESEADVESVTSGETGGESVTVKSAASAECVADSVENEGTIDVGCQTEFPEREQCAKSAKKGGQDGVNGKMESEVSEIWCECGKSMWSWCSQCDKSDSNATQMEHGETKVSLHYVFETIQK